MKTSVALLATFPVIDPVVPPAPIASVPLLTVVAPEYVLAADSTTVPPDTFRPAAPAVPLTSVVRIVSERDVPAVSMPESVADVPARAIVKPVPLLPIEVFWLEGRSVPPEKLKLPTEPATVPVVSEFTASSPAERLIVPVPEVALESLPPRLLFVPESRMLAEAPLIVTMPVPPP